jgi:hypothetical protein
MGLTILLGMGSSYTVSREFFLDTDFMNEVLAPPAASPHTCYADVLIGQRRLEMLKTTVMLGHTSHYSQQDRAQIPPISGD